MTLSLRAALSLLATLVLLGSTCTQNHKSAAPPPTERPPGERREAAAGEGTLVYEGGLKGAWQDWGWAPRDLEEGEPARLDLSNYGGWILARPGEAAQPSAVVFRFHAAPEHGDFLEVRLADGEGGSEAFPAVVVAPRHRRPTDGGWEEVVVDAAELNPRGRPFDRLTLRARRALPKESWVLVDGVLILGGAASATREASLPTQAPRAFPKRPARVEVSCAAPASPISPGIYGIAVDVRQESKHRHAWELGATGRRWGGNSHERYNWELGNAWNTASDWYFRNVDYGRDARYSWRTFLDDNGAKGVDTALSIPLIGHVAKDTTSFSFPVSRFGPQAAVDPSVPDAGNGVTPALEPIKPGPPSLTSVPADPAFMGRWVKAIREHDAAQKRKSVQLYILGNEPMLWHDTHRDVHPEPVGYDELLERTLAYGQAVKKADPDAVIAGPAVWGWPAYFHSAKDSVAGFWRRPDRRAHGDVPFLNWYLKKLRDHEKATGERLLDHVDVHFYPEGLYNDTVDAETAARRLRSTRSLWDPTYVEETYIREPVRLIPRLKEVIAESYPGRGIVIGEYNFGGERHMSGGLAQAEVLGRFGQGGVHAAYYWTYPSDGSPAFHAFRAYRNYDGEGARFLDLSLPAKAGEELSAFASRDEASTRVVAVVLNMSTVMGAETTVALQGCKRAASARVFTYEGGPRGLEPREASVDEEGVTMSAPPYSFSVVEVTLAD